MSVASCRDGAGVRRPASAATASAAAHDQRVVRGDAGVQLPPQRRDRVVQPAGDPVRPVHRSQPGAEVAQPGGRARGDPARIGGGLAEVAEQHVQGLLLGGEPVQR